MQTEEFSYENESEPGSHKKETFAVIDGLNVAFSRNDGTARLSDLLAIGKRISNEYDRFEILVDASARHKIDNKSEFERLIKRGKIVLCPAGIDGDDLIWLRAKSLFKKDYLVSIVSNDMFPVRRSVEENVPISSVVVSIFHDGEIYFLNRKSKDKITATVPLRESEIHLVEVQH